MFRTISVAVIALCVSLSAAANTLTVSSDSTPIDRMMLEVVTAEALSRIGHDLEMVRRPSERSLREANNGQVDGEGLRVAGLSKRYPNLIQVPEAIHRIDFVAFTNGNEISVSRWSDLASHSVVFINGWQIFEKKTAGMANVRSVGTAEQMFRMLDHGRVDVALYTRADGEALAREGGFGNIHAQAAALKTADLYLYLNVRHRDLVPQIAEALRDMKSDGAYAAIRAGLVVE